MGCPLTEFVFESVIRDGLGDLRTTPSKLDDIFSGFLAAYQSTQYGQAKIDEIKTYIVNNQIRIVQALGMAPMSVPCISIQLMRAAEDSDIQNIGNEFEERDDSTTPTVYIPTITPGTYNNTTGILTVVNAVDLSTVCPGWIYVDASDNKFAIGSGNSNLSGDKFINIGPGQTPDIGGDGRIESSIDVIRTERRMIRLRETISLGCHAKDDIHLTKLIYYILVYILKSRQESLITRGITLDAGDASLFDRAEEYQGENIFSRYTSVGCITEYIWDQGEVNLIDCFDATITLDSGEPNDC